MLTPVTDLSFAPMLPPFSRFWRSCLPPLLLLVAALACRYGLAPRMLALPDDFSYSAQVVSRDNFYDEWTRRFQGEVQSSTELVYDVLEREGNVMIVRNAFDVRNRGGEPIFSVERRYAVDRFSGRHVAGRGDKDREGFLFAPRLLSKEDVTYWHVNYDTPVQLRFRDEETVEGLRLYRYERTFHADQTENLRHLPFVGTARGVNLDVHLQVWFEPVSGRMVKYADQATAYFYDLSTGKRLSPWNRFSNAFSEKSVQEQVRLASQEKLKGEMFARYLPALLVGLALLWAMATAVRTLRWAPSIGRREVVIVSLILLSCGLTVARWGYLTTQKNAKLAARFTADTASITTLITERMNAQVGLLEGARGLFDVLGKPLAAAQWKSYAQALRLEQYYPGLQGIGFAPLIQSQDKPSFQEKMEKEGALSYDIFPAGNRAEYVPVAYLEPSDERNRRAIGYDMFSETVRREAIMAAADTGMPALSGKVTLVQETENAQSGVLLYLPVYRPAAMLDTVEQRRDALLGFVYSPFRMQNFIHSLMAGRELGIDMEIYDGTEENMANPVQRMYSSLPRTRRAATPLISDTRTVWVVGRPWTFHFSSMPGYGSRTWEERMPTVVLVSGFVFTVLLLLGFLSVCRWSSRDPSARSPFVKRSPIKDIL